MTADSRSNQRAAILDAVRRSGHTVESSEEEIHREAVGLLSDIEDARPPLLAADIVEAFRLRFEKGLVVGTTCEEITDIGKLPTAVHRYLERYKLPLSIKLQPLAELTGLDWVNFRTEADVEQDEAVSVCRAEYGIAETGSVVVHSSAEMPVLLSFLPLHAIVVVPRSKILPFLDDYAFIARNMARDSSTPRNMCLITGASGTTDIEGVLVKGAHGPKFLHLVIDNQC
jgi:L-lactate dehydrogenase complex protein LldG